ncbi:MAG: DUF6249 domain-containing protein [Phenylobacterium sp.]|jgi:hypothetical protein|uniref:DUF6249 domain-containing protein n=1 Tax=Phenylobacterium sp. TaxID=1871053 RepID=UPI002A25311D|nr:DUF6249 domain-containing protein [Phenylobacterium sp.]MDD3836835.1 DUF6249 domain-containing protein [Phenylobacterium sp.]MDX9998231.1 DUF6249 domain-containing protein [Phenylobacterium sp.]
MEILVPLGLFAMIAAIVIVPRYFRSLEQQKLQETLRAAVERGEPIPPEIVQAMTQPVKEAKGAYRHPDQDLRQGIVWLAVGVGLALMGYFVGYNEPDATHVFMGIAAIPGLIGLAFIVLWAVGRKKN